MITIQNLSIDLGTFSLRDINLTVAAGNYGVLMGKTGCGKTTVLEAICGLRSIKSGQIHLAGRDVSKLKPAERRVGFVPQEGALFTTMSVRRNIGFALSIRRWSKKTIKERIGFLAESIGITHLLDRKPEGLSGGERQRVALARALSFEPPILCLDEPLSALDDDTRAEMCRLLQSITKNTGVTTLHITHNREEAVRLANQIFLFDEGRIKEISHEQVIRPVGEMG